MKRLLATLLACVLAALHCAAQETAVAGQEPDVRLAGTLSTRALLLSVVRETREKENIVTAVSTVASSAEVIDAVGTGAVGVGLIAREMKGLDRSRYPAVELVTTPVGMEVVALGVSNDIWKAGIHAITREQMRDIYEAKTTNWHALGGPDEKIQLFNYPPGEGIWEIFAEWMYGDNRKAPFPKVQRVNSSEDARDSLEFNEGSIAPLSATAVDGRSCHALGIKLPDGTVANPVNADIAARKYEIVRPVLAVTAGRPALLIRKVIEFLTGPDGQALVKKAGQFGQEAVPAPKKVEYNAY